MPTHRPELRSTLRAILSAAPTRRFPEALILLKANEILAAEDQPLADTPELRAALEWNHAKGHIDYTTNHDLDRDEWSLTTKGKQTEGLL